MEQPPSQNPEESKPRSKWDNFREELGSYRRHRKTEAPDNKTDQDSTQEQEETLMPPKFFVSPFERKEDEKKWEKNIKKIKEVIDLDTGEIKDTIEVKDENTGEIKKIPTPREIIKKIEEAQSKTDVSENNARKFVQETINELTGFKKIVQQADSANMDNIKIELRRRKGFEYPKGSKNKYWKQARKTSYKDAWDDLKTYAQDHKIQDFVEQAYDRETEQKHRTEALYNTGYALGHTAIAGALTGTFLAPWKLTELAMKQILPYFLDDKESARKMLEAFFGKKDEKAKTTEKKKDDKPDYEKEHETKIKIKKIEIKYIEGLKNEIIEQKAEDGRKSEEKEYATLTDERKKELRDTAGKRGYENVWRTLRVHWIQEEVWTIDDEKEFRKVIGGDSELKLRDIITGEELKILEDARRKKINLKKEIKAADNEEERDKLDKALAHAIERIADIENRQKVRIEKMQWPQYKKGKKKGGTSAENFVTTEDEADEDEKSSDD